MYLLHHKKNENYIGVDIASRVNSLLIICIEYVSSEKLVSAAALPKDSQATSLSKTRQVVCGLLERLDLLLQVTIAPSEGDGASGIKRSVSHMPEPYKQGGKFDFSV